jgi:hypothetical protein
MKGTNMFAAASSQGCIAATLERVLVERIERDLCLSISRKAE